MYRSTEKRDQDEDFFTEVVRGLFEHRPDLLRDWLRHLEIEVTDEAEFFVDSQHPYSTQEDTAGPRRPDLFVRIDELDGRRTVVLVESKLGAGEGEDQLTDYARILARQHAEADCRVLVYVTQYFDGKTESEVKDGVDDGSVKFIQSRWHKFYRLIASRSNSGAEADFLVDNALRYMEKNGMATANQFGPDDFIAFRAIRGAVKIMEEVLSDSIADRLRTVMGAKKKPSAHFSLVRERFTFNIFAQHLFVMLGFFLDRDGDYPTLGLMLQVRPESVQEPGLFDGLHSRLNRGWESRKLETRKKWSGIVLEKSLRKFSHEDDQVLAMQDYCDQLIGELKTLWDENPAWFAPGDAPDDKEMYGE